ncbi:unnamed protein product [Bursaphelenchus xylophilus]|uniref:(pine wood nematode) hypothetical protein n=1 Tax=Bursaphelenchus xylophilus TaxID=6326 RepID=A0A1I7S1D0_BURXY|nr:unnamed protein product [Bursaphelenchus xylophilus]CAG9080286.1 unnamed protein product [Bursaphelenchus xylophilus]
MKAQLLCLILLPTLIFAFNRRHEHGERAHRLLIRGTGAKCQRFCTYRVGDVKKQFPLKKLDSKMCSHLVLSSAEIMLNGDVLISEPLSKVIEEYKKWPEVKKPVLILSIGANTDEKVWRRVVQSSFVRRRLVQRLAQLYTSLDVDGISIDWIQGEVSNRDSFAKLFSELRRQEKFPEFAVLAATITDESTTKDGYDITVLNSTANFLIIEGSRLQKHEQIVTKGVKQQEPKRTVESVAIEWEAYGVPKRKLILGYSVATPAKLEEEDVCALPAVSDASSERQKPNRGIGVGVRAFAVGPISPESAPVDSRRAMRQKTQWASLNQFGGIALRGIENDRAQCATDSFPVLRAIVESQTC